MLIDLFDSLDIEFENSSYRPCFNRQARVEGQCCSTLAFNSAPFQSSDTWTTLLDESRAISNPIVQGHVWIVIVKKADANY